jgi:hypothetical protein
MGHVSKWPPFGSGLGHVSTNVSYHFYFPECHKAKGRTMSLNQQEEAMENVITAEGKGRWTN